MQAFKFGDITGYYLPHQGESLKGTVYCYHGWGSNAYRQRLRGDLFTRYGYEVILPDALAHGKRGKLHYGDSEVFGKNFFQTVRQNLEEFDFLKNEVSTLGVENKNIIVMGHSMGAYSASGLLFNNQSLNAGLFFNGSLYWSKTLDKMKLHFGHLMNEISPWVLRHSPENFKENIEKISYFSANGLIDETVSPEENQHFFSDYKAHLKKSKMNFYEEIGHQISEKMLFDALSFLNEI